MDAGVQEQQVVHLQQGALAAQPSADHRDEAPAQGLDPGLRRADRDARRLERPVLGPPAPVLGFLR